MFIFLDLKKSEEAKAPKDENIPEGAKPAGVKKQSKYGQKVWHRAKDRYPKRPNNVLGETNSTWVLPYGQNPQYTGSNTNKEDNTSKDAPTAEEHQKLSDLAREMGNTKLADKHAELSKPKEPVADVNTGTTESLKIPETDTEKAQNLLHNSKASETKKKAKEILNRVPSTHKEALKKIIDVLEEHETKPHVPTNQEKKELREISQAVNNMAKPVDKKRAEVDKEFKNKLKDKEKENKRIYIKTEKDKEKTKQKEEKDKAKAKEKEQKELERAKKEEAKVATRKQKEHDKLKEKLSRDVKKPASIEEQAQKQTHIDEAKQLLQQIEAKLKESKGNPDLEKLLEAHRSVAQRQLDVDRLPTKEDIKALKDSKKVIQGKIKEEKDLQKEKEAKNTSVVQERSIRDGKSSATKTRNAYNTGRASGETLAHQATEESGGQLTGKTAGALGYGVASAGHKLLTNEDDNKATFKKEVRKALEGAFGIDSETNRNTDTFDDEQPVGQGSDIPEEDEDFGKSVLQKLRAILPNVNSLEKEFLIKHLGYSPDSVHKGEVVITGFKKGMYQGFVCNKLQNSIKSLIKSL